MTPDINTIIANIIVGALTGISTFIAGQLWVLIKLGKKNSQDINVAFSKIRNLENCYAELDDLNIEQNVDKPVD